MKVKMIRYCVNGYITDENGRLHLMEWRVRGVMKESKNFIGAIFRRHPELRKYTHYKIVETPL